MTTPHRLGDIEIKGHLQTLGLVIGILRQIDIDGLLREFSLNDSIGMMFDPTGWMATQPNARKNERVIRALGVFLKEVREAWPEMFEDRR